MSDGAVTVLVGVAMAAGVAGTVVPVVPGLLLVWAAAVAYAVAVGPGVVGVVALVVITGLAVAGAVAGVALPRRAAGGAGAATTSLWLGAALAVVGFFVVPVVGLALGGALGILLGERLRTGDGRLAWQATWATLKGFGLGALVQVGAGLAMVLTWLAWVVLE